ncbi:MAG: transglutaminase domain-containing protein [Bacteroidota bacterium]
MKSEIVRADGSITPAEEGSGTLVFSDLKVGDVIYIEYEDFDINTGRFYKDFNLSCYFNSNYPAVEAIFCLIHPSDTQYLSAFKNGEVPSTTKKVNNKTCTIWKKSNVPALPLNENFSFAYSDLNNSIKVSTIKSWKEISNWYADLVKKNLELDKITKNTFQQIFPSGVSSLSENQIAEKIYAYIEDNITYSSLDFRQSGYVPQKPSKTITTKLGDCKDVSTLFVALSKFAGLKSNLVLVSTNDNGFKNMPLPAVDFNHCIVKVTLDKKDYFLELTDKYLPFKALPRSLYKANALVISFDKAENENAKLISINFDNAINSKVETKTVVEISDNAKKFVNQNTLFGSVKSYYSELFSSATSEDVRKKSLEDLYNSRLSKNISLQSSKLLTNVNYDDKISFQTEFIINERIQAVGNLKITELPFLDRVITRDIISAETRNYDINYIDYEDTNEYNNETVLKVEEGKKFTEIPESKILKYKNYEYSIKFELEKPNLLKINRAVKTSWDTIPVADYADFKKFVEEVIAVEEQIVGFK